MAAEEPMSVAERKLLQNLQGGPDCHYSLEDAELRGASGHRDNFTVMHCTSVIGLSPDFAKT